MLAMSLGAAIVHAAPSVEVSISPQSAPLNTPRTITLVYTVDKDRCKPELPIDFALDTSRVQTSSVLEIAFLYGPATIITTGCYAPPGPRGYIATYTPVQVGELTLRVTDPRGASATAVIKTVDGPRIRSKFDTTGIWWDPATSGSGLSIIHAYGTTDVAVLSWYAHGAAPEGTPSARWFSVQGLQWTEDGSVLEGGAAYLSSATGCANPTLPSGERLDTCPSKSGALTAFAKLRVKFESANRARVEAFTSNGKPLFVSNIQRFEF